MLRRLATTTRVACALVVGALLLAPGSTFAQGCSMCGSSLQNPDDPLVRSISQSILFMASMPFVLFATVAGWIFWRLRPGRPDNVDEVEDSPR